MAKRTYHDANGYKRKRRKRGTPEFATVEEYNAWIAEKKRSALKVNPIKALPQEKPEVLKALEALTIRVEQVCSGVPMSSDSELPLQDQ